MTAATTPERGDETTHAHTGAKAPVQIRPKGDDGDRAPDAGVTEEMKEATGSAAHPHAGGNASG